MGRHDDVVKLALDVYRNSTGSFSAQEAEETLRKALIDLCGGVTFGFKDLRRNKVEVFEIIEETLAVLVNEDLEDQFSEFAEIRNLALGDTNVFTVEDNKLFAVARIADGNMNIRRQRLESGTFTVTTDMYAVKIYEEFNRFLAGRTNWANMVNKVARSWTNKLRTDIYEALYDSYTDLDATYGVSGVFNEGKLIELCQHVEAGTGYEVEIMGTVSALSKVTPSIVSDVQKGQRNELGYYGIFNGYPLRPIKQAHRAGTDTFAINDSFLIVTPVVPDKMVKVVNEGEAYVFENSGGTNADMSMEYFFGQKVGIAVVPASKYGIYRITTG